MAEETYHKQEFFLFFPPANQCDAKLFHLNYINCHHAIRRLMKEPHTQIEAQVACRLVKMPVNDISHYDVTFVL